MDFLKAPPPRPPSTVSSLTPSFILRSTTTVMALATTTSSSSMVAAAGAALLPVINRHSVVGGSDTSVDSNNNNNNNNGQLVSNPLVKDTYDYVLIDIGNPDSYLSESVNNFINDTFYNGTIVYYHNNHSLNSLKNNNTTSIINNDDVGDLIIMSVTSIILGLMILITVIGNVFVIAAIILERNLQNVANYLVASLAVADLLVACLVMPLGAVYEISKGWILGPELCDIWTSCDVLCCTASILHLVAIATDRYWAVTNVDYMHSRTSRRVFTMIFLVWFASVIVSLAPQFGWKDPEYLERIEQQKCMVSQDVAYQVFATCCTFYVPLLVILVLYWKIYQTARKRIHRRPRPQPISANNNQTVPSSSSTSRKTTKSRLRFRLASKFTNQGRRSKAAVSSSLGLVEGNSTNTVNTVEDTEYSGGGGGGGGGSGSAAGVINTNLACTEIKGIEVTTFNKDEDTIRLPSNNQIITVSEQVTIVKENQQDNQLVIIPEKQNQINQEPLLPITPITAISPPITMINATTSVTASSASPTTTKTILQQQTQQQSQQHGQPASIIISHVSGSNIGGSGVSSNVAVVGSSQGGGYSTNNPHSQVTKRKETLEAKRERKAAKTLAIITGAFVICWLPFFLMALLLPLCDTCEINDSIASFFLWLGYFNSTLNPVIYTIFSPEFRQAFKRILFGAHRTGYYRSGKF